MPGVQRAEEAPWCPFVSHPTPIRPGEFSVAAMACARGRCALWNIEMGTCALAAIPGVLWHISGQLDAMAAAPRGPEPRPDISSLFEIGDVFGQIFGQGPETVGDCKEYEETGGASPSPTERMDDPEEEDL